MFATKKKKKEIDAKEEKQAELVQKLDKNTLQISESLGTLVKNFIHLTSFLSGEKFQIE